MKLQISFDLTDLDRALEIAEQILFNLDSVQEVRLKGISILVLRGLPMETPGERFGWRFDNKTIHQIYADDQSKGRDRIVRSRADNFFHPTQHEHRGSAGEVCIPAIWSGISDQEQH